MKILLFLNGLKESQKGIEYGFQRLVEKKIIGNVKFFYYEYHAKITKADILPELLGIAVDYQPQFIVFFHVTTIKITLDFLLKLKRIDSGPKIIYDEGDVYGKYIKPFTPSIKLMMRNSDMVSIRGLGPYYNMVSKYNSKIIFTPHSNSLNYLTNDLEVASTRSKKFLFIGNKVTSRLGNVFRLPGARSREELLIFLNRHYSDKAVAYGNGWQGLEISRGQLDFERQVSVCSQYWFHIAYEHFPDISFYFSDRLPVALACGQIYICHYHEGYDEFFKDVDFIYFYRSLDELPKLLDHLLKLDDTELKIKSNNAIVWSRNHLNADVVWNSFVKKIVNSCL